MLKRAVLAAALALLGTAARADCVSLSVPHAAIAGSGGRWTEMSPAQWQFLRGVYVVDPETPPGLPSGESAILAQVVGSENGLILFVDDGMACGAMPIPARVVELLHDVGLGKIEHEGVSQ